MNIIIKTKRFIIKASESLLFLAIKRAPEAFSLVLARLMRKLLFRENFIEKSSFKDFKEYKDFVEAALKNVPISTQQRSMEGRSAKANLSSLPPNMREKKVFFICCDGNQNKSRKIPSTFLDVWRDAACDAGLIVKISIANEFMYDALPGSVINKNQYISGVIDQIKKFEADIVFLDTNYCPNVDTLNEEDVDKIKRETNVKIYGHTGDILNYASVKCLKCGYLL